MKHIGGLRPTNPRAETDKLIADFVQYNIPLLPIPGEEGSIGTFQKDDKIRKKNAQRCKDDYGGAYNRKKG